MIQKAIVYGLIDPRDGKVYYVGQSRTGLKRARRHISAGALIRDAGTPKVRWLLELQAVGVDPLYTVLENVLPGTSPLEREVHWITTLRQDNPALTNVSAADRAATIRGVPLTDNHKRRLRTTLKAVWSDPNKRAALSVKLKGRKPSTETRLRMSASQQKRMRDVVQKRTLLEGAAAYRRTHGGPSGSAFGLKVAKARGARAFTDQFGNRYLSVRAAGRSLGVDSSAISKVLKGRLSHTQGYVFTYITGEGVAGDR